MRIIYGVFHFILFGVFYGYEKIILDHPDRHGPVGAALTFQMVVFASYSYIGISDYFVHRTVHVLIMQWGYWFAFWIAFFEHFVD